MIAGLEGTVEIGRQGMWSAATLGGAVGVGDELRTSPPGRVRVVFQDGSVLNIGHDSHVVIDEHVFDPEGGRFRSVVRLLEGRVSALVSEYYRRPGAVYEIETATAVAAVRGTEFVIAYDPVGEVTEVVGVANQVAVNSVMDRAARGVVVTAQHLTLVARGQFPTAPTRVGDALFRQYIEDLEFIGNGKAESMAVVDPLLAGAAVPPQDQAGALPAPAGVAREAAGPPRTDYEFDRDASDAIANPPDVIQAGELGIRF